ncbi:MAG: ABC transporter permease [Deltaproteobacteria bacterium]|nr:ABC transporter permease [Deltaproteobacteria bacterium]
MKLWLFRISLGHLREYPGRTFLGILGIALGTAVYLSISLAADSAVRSFQAGVTAVAGKAQWRVQSPGAPLNEDLFPKLRHLPEIKAAAPVVESILELSGPYQGPVLLLGIDPFSEKYFRDYEFEQGNDLSERAWVDFLTRPDTILVADRLAARLKLKVGELLPVLVGPARNNLLIGGIFRSPSGLYPLEGGVVLMDIGAAQELLHRLGRLDYIDLITRGSESGVRARLQKELPPGVEVVRPAALAQRTEGLVAAYRLNLAVLSAIALFVGMFLIYQSVTLSVVRRRREIGLLRTLGMTPGQVLLLFLSEGAVSGLAGGFVGLILGVGFAKGVLAVMTRNLTSLYMPVVAETVRVQGGLLVQAWGLAVAATLIAAALPAWEAARTQLRAVWHREELEERLESRVGLITWWGLMCLALAVAFSAWKVTEGPPWPGFAAAFLILLGFALLTPVSARFLGERLEARLGTWPAASLGCRHLSGSLSRAAVSIAALACALGMLIAVTVMIGSFRQTVNDWVSRAISGDIFFGPAMFSTAGYDQYLPPEILPELERDPEIADIYHYRVVRLPFKGRDILVIGGSFEVLAKHGGLWFRQGETRKIMQEVASGTGETPALPRPNPPLPPFSKGGESPPLAKGDLGGFSESVKTVEPKIQDAKRQTANGKPSVVISEPLAEAFHYKEGDTLTLPTPSGPQKLKIAGVFYDYRTDGPSVWMDFSNFRRSWRDRHLNAVRLYLKDPAKVPQMQARLQQTYGSRYHLLALSHRELRQGILRIFDETFALTYALEGVAVVVAVFGIITTFLVLIMERERELALLQTIGASKWQILGMVLTESGLASLLSFILGAASGSALSLLLIKVINKQAFGWTIQLHWVPGIYWQSLLLVLCLGLGAAAYPAWRAIQPHLAAILKEE